MNRFWNVKAKEGEENARLDLFGYVGGSRTICGTRALTKTSF